MLEEAALDVVIVETGADIHAEFCCKALAKNINVLSDIPVVASLEEAEKMAALLKQKIHDLNIEHKFSTVSDRVTISQGLLHKVPVAGNKLWDFMYSADMALYIAKANGKNNFHIDTDFDAVREEYNNLKK